MKAGYPTVVFHGIGDTCANPGDIQFTDMISKGTGAYALCVVIGKGDQSMTSWFENLNTQVESACKTIQTDPNL